MHVKTILKKVLTVLNLTDEIKLETAILSDGAIIEADVFEAEAEVFIVTEDERVPLPIGEYTLEGGELLVVKEDGIIFSFEKAEEKTEEEKPVEEVVEEEDLSEDKAPVKKVIESITKEVFFDEMKKRDEKIEALELALESFKKEDEKEEIKEDAEKEIKLETEKVVHSPEKEVSNFKQNRNVADTIQSRIIAAYQN